MSPRVNGYFYNCATPIWGSFCPRNVSHEVQLVELHGTRRGNKVTPKLVLHNYKSIISHEGTCRCNISLKHVPTTFSCVCTCCDFVPATCPCYMSPHCALHKFFFFCRCNMSLQHDPLSLPSLVSKTQKTKTPRKK